MGNTYLPLTGRFGEKSVQCIYWPDAFDQHLASRITRGLNLEVGLEMSDGRAEENSRGVLREYNDIGGVGKTFQASEERLQCLTVPQAVMAFAQAAIKVKDLAGWPLLSPAKVQMQKCGKCSQEFYSPLNYRRHSRTHRRSFHANKEDLRKEKDKIADSWNKLTVEAALQVLSIKDMMIEDLSGMANVSAFTALVQQPGLSVLPQRFVKSGTALLGIVDSDGLASNISAEDLFGILDDASESTFLCGGTSSSMQRFVYYGEAAKFGLEERNLVASLAFLIEQNLVKAWMIDKDTEALKCQKELVEEEEAAQKRKEKVLQKKQQKKMRPREKEKKEALIQSFFYGQDNDLIDATGMLRLKEEEGSPLASESSSMSLASSGHDSNPETSYLQMSQFVVQLEENTLMMSMHTSNQLRSASQEKLQGEEHHTRDYIMSSLEGSVSELISEQPPVIRHKSEVEAVCFYDNQVHQEKSPALFKLKDKNIHLENNTWKYPKRLRYKKSPYLLNYNGENELLQLKAGRLRQGKVRSEQLEFSTDSTRELTDAKLSEAKYSESPYIITSSSKKVHPLATNGMRSELPVPDAAAENDLPPLKLQHYHRKLPKASKVSPNFLNGDADWTKKSPRSSSVDQIKNPGESAIGTSACSDQPDNLNTEFCQVLPGEIPKMNKSVSSSLAEECNIVLHPSDLFASPLHVPSHTNNVHEEGAKSSDTSISNNSKQGRKLRAHVCSEEAIFVSAMSQVCPNLSVGAVVEIEESRVASTSNVAKSKACKIKSVTISEKPVESLRGALLVGSLQVPIDTFVAEMFAQNASVVINNLALNSIFGSVSDTALLSEGRRGENFTECKARDILSGKEQSDCSELMINSLINNSLKANNISDREKGVIQSITSVTEELVLKHGNLSDSGNLLALRIAAETSGNEISILSESSTVNTSTLDPPTFLDVHKQCTSFHYPDNVRVGSIEGISGFKLKDPLYASNSYLASGHGGDQLIRDKEADSGGWCKSNFPAKFQNRRWLSLSDVAVAAFLSHRWNLATKALETAVS